MLSLFNLFSGGFMLLSTLTSGQVVLWAEETSTYSRSRFCTVKADNKKATTNFPTQGPGFEPLTSEMGGECVTTAPLPITH